MRFGLVVYGGLDQQSGGYLYDRQLVAHLRARGHTVEVLAQPTRARYVGRLADNLCRELERAARALGLDVLLQDELNHPSLLWRNPQLRRRLGIPLVAIVHHLRADEAWPAWQRALYRRLERRYLQTVDAWICNSATTRAAVQQLTGSRRPSVVAYPAGDHLGAGSTAAAIAARARRPGPLQLVFVGNLIPRKGLRTLLDGLARLPRGEWRLQVVGDGTVDPAHAQHLRAHAARLGLADPVGWRGPLSDATLPACLRASDVLAVPSQYEGFGIVYLEGMAFGLPALATTAGAAAEIIRPGREGWLVPPDDPAAIAQALAPLLEDRQRLLRLSLAAHERFVAHPTWAQSMARIGDFLERMGTAGWPFPPSTPSTATSPPRNLLTTAR